MHLYLSVLFYRCLLRLMLQHAFHNSISPFAMMIYFFFVFFNIIDDFNCLLLYCLLRIRFSIHQLILYLLLKNYLQSSKGFEFHVQCLQ